MFVNVNVNNLYQSEEKSHNSYNSVCPMIVTENTGLESEEYKLASDRNGCVYTSREIHLYILNTINKRVP